MTPSDKLQADLSYVRRAVERRRRMVCGYMPLWLAGVVGLVFVAILGSRDLAEAGALSSLAAERISDAMKIAIVVAIVAHAWWRRQRGAGESARDRPSAGFRLSESLPAIVMVSGFVLLIGVMRHLGVGDAADGPILTVYAAACAALIGLSYGLNLLLWAGIGLGAGTAVQVFGEFAYGRTLMGLCLGAGIVLGAWLDRRALARAESHDGQ